MQTVLIAGGAGFIGSHLCEDLLNKTYEVIAVDNLLTGSINNLKEFNQNSKFKFIERDITHDLSQIHKEFENIDYVFHLASPASPNKDSKNSYINKPLETLQANSIGTFNLLELAKEKKAKFLYASSSEIYGDPEKVPQKESYWGNVNPVGIRSVYDEGKRFGEAVNMAYFRKYGLDTRIIRIFNTYGPKMQKDDGRVVSNFIIQALTHQPITVYGDGNQTRSFCYISDMIAGLEKAMFTEGTNGKIINLGNPVEYNIQDLAEKVKELLSCSSDIYNIDLPEDDPKRRKPDITVAKNLINWEPKVNIKEGLSLTIEYFKHQI